MKGKYAICSLWKQHLLSSSICKGTTSSLYKRIKHSQKQIFFPWKQKVTIKLKSLDDDKQLIVEMNNWTVYLSFTQKEPEFLTLGIIRSSLTLLLCTCLIIFISNQPKALFWVHVRICWLSHAECYTSSSYKCWSLVLWVVLDLSLWNAYLGKRFLVWKGLSLNCLLLTGPQFCYVEKRNIKISINYYGGVIKADILLTWTMIRLI